MAYHLFGCSRLQGISIRALLNIIIMALPRRCYPKITRVPLSLGASSSQLWTQALPLHVNFRCHSSLACLKTDSTAIQGIQVSIAPMCAIEMVPERVVRVWSSMLHWETSPLAEVSAYCESHSMIVQESLTICAWTRPFFFKSFRTVPWLQHAEVK